MDLCKEEELKLRRALKDAERLAIGQETLITSLAGMVEWEETAHKLFTDDLKKEGLTVEDITRKGVEQLYIKDAYGSDKYYQGLMMLSDIEK